MRRLTVILVLISVLLTATPLQQMLKLPVLVQHFYEHKKLNDTLSFFAFIQAHYFNAEEDTDSDDSRDEALPFKTVHNIVSIAINALPVADETYTACPVEKTQLNHILADDTFILSQYLSSIWQPPRVC